MLSTEGKHKDTFPDTYHKFVQSMGRLEFTLCAYVKTTITEKTPIKNGLAVIQRYGNLYQSTFHLIGYPTFSNHHAICTEWWAK